LTIYKKAHLPTPKPLLTSRVLTNLSCAVRLGLMHLLTWIWALFLKEGPFQAARSGIIDNRLSCEKENKMLNGMERGNGL